MILNKFNKRLIAARRPFAVVEIKNNPRITNVNGKRSSYNIVGKNGSGVAEFGCDELAATWFCEAANHYADEISNRRSTTPTRNCDRFNSGNAERDAEMAWDSITSGMDLQFSDLTDREIAIIKEAMRGFVWLFTTTDESEAQA